MPCRFVIDFIDFFRHHEKSCKESRHLSFVRRCVVDEIRPQENQYETAELDVAAVNVDASKGRNDQIHANFKKAVQRSAICRTG